MKLKRWLSRALVLAMVVALMIPVPVAAKSSGGGKLVKSVTVYDYQKASGRWKAISQDSYKYDKKNYPVEIGETTYTEWFLGVPVNGNKKVSTIKYKYKGKSPKSAKVKDGSGKVVSTRKYKSGKVVSIASASMTSDEVTDWVGDTEVFKGDNVYASNGTTNISYNKSGLAVSTTYAGANSEKYVSGSADAGTNNNTNFYAITHKKGVPSLIIRSNANGYTSSSVSAGGSSSSSYQRNADGTWVRVNNGVTTYGKTDVTNYYSTFDKNGRVVEEGEIDIDSTTGLQKIFPTYRYVYSVKKGKVNQVVGYSLETNEYGVVTKITPDTLWQFKYTKAKASKVRYLSMINSFLGATGFFAWY